jgi:hypothetical protein
MSNQILQIMPATGWVAVYNVDGGESADPVVCFALVEGGGTRSVRPMCAEDNKIVFADEIEGFSRVDTEDAFEEDEEEDEEDEE